MYPALQWGDLTDSCSRSLIMCSPSKLLALDNIMHDGRCSLFKMVLGVMSALLSYSHRCSRVQRLTVKNQRSFGIWHYALMFIASQVCSKGCFSCQMIHGVVLLTELRMACNDILALNQIC